MSSYPILVGFDGSEGAKAALQWAADEAARSGAPLELLYAFEWQAVAGPIAPGPGSWPDRAARDDAKRMVDTAVAEILSARPQASVTGSVEVGSAAAMLEQRSRHARLVVLGNRGHGGFLGLLIGSTSVTVAAHAHCPVAVIRGDVAADPAAPVVVGTDGSDCSMLAVEYAFAQAAARGVPLRVVHAYTLPTPRWRPPEGFDPEEITVAERSALDEMLAGWRDKYPTVPVTLDVIADTPGHVMVEATRAAALVVVGSRGRGGFRGLLLGSVGGQLIHHAHCPVIVVRELPSPPA